MTAVRLGILVGQMRRLVTAGPEVIADAELLRRVYHEWRRWLGTGMHSRFVERQEGIGPLRNR